MSKKKIGIIIVGIVAVSMIAGYFVFKSATKEVQTSSTESYSPTSSAVASASSSATSEYQDISSDEVQKIYNTLITESLNSAKKGQGLTASEVDTNGNTYWLLLDGTTLMRNVNGIQYEYDNTAKQWIKSDSNTYVVDTNSAISSSDAISYLGNAADYGTVYKSIASAHNQVDKGASQFKVWLSQNFSTLYKYSSEITTYSLNNSKLISCVAYNNTNYVFVGDYTCSTMNLTTMSYDEYTAFITKLSVTGNNITEEQQYTPAPGESNTLVPREDMLVKE